MDIRCVFDIGTRRLAPLRTPAFGGCWHTFIGRIRSEERRPFGRWRRGFPLGLGGGCREMHRGVGAGTRGFTK